MQVGAIHAGLECGIILEKVPGMDAVSYGPTIKGAHSPDERVEIATVAPFWEATLKILGMNSPVPMLYTVGKGSECR